MTVPFQVCSIAGKNKPFQSGSVFYERAKPTGELYKHRVIFTVDGRITLRNILCNSVEQQVLPIGQMK